MIVVLAFVALACAGPEQSLASHQARLCSATSGPWHLASTWSCGAAPIEGDEVIIDDEQTVTLAINTPVLGRLTVSGTLQFSPAQSVTLKSKGNIIVRGSGRLEMRPEDADVTHEIEFVDVDETLFKGPPGPTEANPMAPCSEGPAEEPCDTDVGLWVMDSGTLDAIGSPKTAWTRLVGSASMNDSQVVVENTDGWRPGDALVIVPTLAPNQGTADEYWTGYDEAVVATIAGQAVTLNNYTLLHDHPRVNDQWSAEVINLSRNVRIHGSAEHRAHISFHHFESPQTIKHVEVYHMAPQQNGEGIKGRYGLHLHMGHDHARGSLLEGLSLHDLGFRAYVPHASHGVTIRNSTSHANLDEAFWWDEGASDDSHDALWDGNLASRQGNYPAANRGAYALGNGRGNQVINSVAVGVKGDLRSAGFQWPDHAIQSPWTFRNNVSHNNQAGGLFTWQNGDKVHVVEDSVAYHNNFGLLHGAYGNRYVYRNLTLYGNWIGLDLHSSSTDSGANQQTIENFTIDGGGFGKYGVVVSEHNAAPAAATLIRNTTVRNLCDPCDTGWGMFFKWAGARANSAREWLILENNTFAVRPERLYYFASAIWPESDVVVHQPDGAVYSLHPHRTSPPAATLGYTSSLSEAFAGPAWPARFVLQRTDGLAPTLAVSSGKGSITAATTGGGGALLFDSYQQAIDVDLSSTASVTADGSVAGLIARRSDTDRETYYRLEIGTATANVPLRISKVVDGTVTVLGTPTPAKFLTPGTAALLRFQVQNEPGGTRLHARLGSDPAWDIDILDAEPRLANRFGRFGIFASNGVSGAVLVEEYASEVLDALPVNQNWSALVQSFVPSGTPVVDGGPNQSTFLPNAGVALQATVTDGGAVNPAEFTYAWTKVTGPSAVAFSAATSPATLATFDAPGLYTLRLTASDGSHTGQDDVRVIVAPAQVSGSVVLPWSGSGPWPAPWAAGRTTGTPLVTVAGGDQGRIRHNAGSTVQYVDDRNAENIDLTCTIRIEANNHQAGLVARMLESDPDTWLGARMGTTQNSPDNLQIYMMVDGELNTLAYRGAMFGNGATWNMRFVVSTEPSGQMNLRVRVWDPTADADGDSQPDGDGNSLPWSLEVLDWVNPIFQGRAGRFGVSSVSGSSPRDVYFSNFEARQTTTLAEHWDVPNSNAWPSPWVGEGSAVSVTTANGQGRVYFNPTGGTVIQYVGGHTAKNIDLLTKVRISANNAAAGIMALRNDADPDSYVGVSFGTNPLLANDRLRLFKVIDGVRQDAEAIPSAVAAGENYWLNFVVSTTTQGTSLKAKVWPYATDPEGDDPPSTWTIESEPNWDAGVLNGRAGRFGLIAGPAQALRNAYFDDFRATFVEE